MPKPCVAANCKNTTDNNKDVSFHKFPKDEKQQAEWIRQVKRTRAQWDGPTSDFTFVCSDHFTEDCYERAPQIKTDLGWNVKRKRILQKDAVPTIFLCPETSHSATKQPRISKAYKKQNRLRIVSEVLNEVGVMDCDNSAEAVPSSLEAETQLKALEAACQTAYVAEKKLTRNKKVQAVVKGGKQKSTQTRNVETVNKSIQVGDGQVGNLDDSFVSSASSNSDNASSYMPSTDSEDEDEVYFRRGQIHSTRPSVEQAEASILDQPKFLVFWSCLQMLLSWLCCPACHSRDVNIPVFRWPKYW